MEPLGSRQVVDHQSHWYPPAYFETILERDQLPYARRRDDGGWVFHDSNGVQFVLPRHFCDLEIQIAGLDAAGIDVMVVSPSLPGDVTKLELGEAVETVRILNDEMARGQREHPERFVGLAMLPLQDVDASLSELERAIGDLGLAGVCVNSNIDRGPIADERTLPIYRRIEELGVPLFIHPANSTALVRPGDSLTVERGIYWMMDTTLAALALIFSGTLDDCPELVVVHPHVGGVLPYAAWRLGATAERMPAVVQRPIAEYLSDRFYTDTVSATPMALSLGVEVYGPEHVLFATDYPWQPRENMAPYVTANLPAEQAEAVIGANRLPGLRLPGDG